MKRYEEISLTAEQKRKLVNNVLHPKHKKNYHVPIIVGSFIALTLFLFFISFNSFSSTITASTEQKQLNVCMTAHSCFVKENVILWSINVGVIIAIYVLLLVLAVQPANTIKFRLIARLHELATTRKLYRLSVLPIISIVVISCIAFTVTSPNQVFIWSLVLLVPMLYLLLQFVLLKKRDFDLRCPSCLEKISKFRVVRTCKHCKKEYTPVIETKNLMYPLLLFVVPISMFVPAVSIIQVSVYFLFVSVVNIYITSALTTLETK